MSQIYKTVSSFSLHYPNAMKNITLKFTFLLICLGALTFAISAQEKAALNKTQTEKQFSNTEAQLAAMKKMDFLLGKWRGEGWVMTYQGKRETFVINETVEQKLGGLIVQLEGLGKSKDENGAERITHNAVGMLSFDKDAGTYRFKSYTFQGNSVDTTANVSDKLFVWGFNLPQVGETRYTIRLNEKGNWHEIGEVTRDGGKNWFKFLEMELQKIQ